MAITTRTVTHAFAYGDGTPCSGKIVFTLTGRMTNTGSSIMPSEVTASLDGTGNISQVLACNNDTGTTPSGIMWRVGLHIAGIEPEDFYIAVPAGSGSIDLGTLLPSTVQVS